MTENDALKMIEMSLDKLKAYKMIPEDTVFSESLTLLGPGSPLDSIGFVTFITDIEERISIETDKEIYLVLNEISDFNVNQSHLLAEQLARYLMKVSEEN